MKEFNQLFPDLHVVNDVVLSKFNVPREDCKMIRLWNFHSHREYYDLTPGEYVRLSVDNETVMSNTPMEVRTNQEFIQEAKGDVFIAGLGIGMVIYEILKKPEVNSITVVEVNKTVIDVVMPYLSQIKGIEKVKIIHGDVFNIELTEKFDTIYFDIWNTISGNNYPEMKLLTKKYQKNKRQRSQKILHWRKEDCRYLNNN